LQWRIWRIFLRIFFTFLLAYLHVLIFLSIINIREYKKSIFGESILRYLINADLVSILFSCLVYVDSKTGNRVVCSCDAWGERSLIRALTFIDTTKRLSHWPLFNSPQICVSRTSSARCEVIKWTSAHSRSN